MDGVLNGVKVLDLTRVLAGPYCTMMLGDMGANVIKIELPGVGDDTRSNSPFINGESSYYMAFNRSKRSFTLDLKNPKGKQLFLDMVKDADIVVENFRPGVMKNLGLSYEDLKKVNPKIVMGSISGYGQYGPYSQQPGYDLIAQAMSGLMTTTGFPGSGPVRAGASIGDVMGGISCCVGILGAYINAMKTGEGQWVDVALTDAVVSLMHEKSRTYFASGNVPSTEYQFRQGYPFRQFQAGDGKYMVMCCGNDKLFFELAKTVGHPEWTTDEAFRKNQMTDETTEAIENGVIEWLSTKTAKEAVDLLIEAGVPAAHVLAIDEVAQDPHVAGAREMFIKIQHPVAGETTLVNNQIKFSDKKIVIDRPAPLLGQHNDEILTEMGYSPEQIQEMRDENLF